VTDDELDRWWPDLAAVVAELRRDNQPQAADRLLDAVHAGATSSEILGGVGVVLREQRAFRSKLSDAVAKSWDTVMADVDKAFPPSKPVNFTFTSRRRP
jgi:hypothetical protein